MCINDKCTQKMCYGVSAENRVFLRNGFCVCYWKYLTFLSAVKTEALFIQPNFNDKWKGFFQSVEELQFAILKLVNTLFAQALRDFDLDNLVENENVVQID